jgi:hypothetical protein
VSVIVVGLADKPTLADTLDLNAIFYPRAIAIAVAKSFVSVLIPSSMALFTFS